MTAGEPTAPSVAEIQAAHRELGDRIRETPTWEWQGHRLRSLVSSSTHVQLKLELFQHTGSFKPRGALCVMLALDAAQLQRGVTAVSAGNHAMAVAFAARALGSHAKVAMPKTADSSRVRACRELGAEVVLTEDIAAAFATVETLQKNEGRHFVHLVR